MGTFVGPGGGGAPDLSHLTEEERFIIEGVMQKQQEFMHYYQYLGKLQKGLFLVFVPLRGIGGGSKGRTTKKKLSFS